MLRQHCEVNTNFYCRQRSSQYSLYGSGMHDHIKNKHTVVSENHYHIASVPPYKDDPFPSGVVQLYSEKKLPTNAKYEIRRKREIKAEILSSNITD